MRPAAGRGTQWLVAVAGAALSALTVLLLAGHGPWSGEVLVSVTRHHGLNVGDLPVLAIWAIGTTACALLWQRTGR